MKKHLIILAVILLAITLLCLIPFIIHYSTLPRETCGTVVGEVLAVKTSHIYIKPINDDGTKQLLEFRLTEDTTFNSDTNHSDNVHELTVGTKVEIDYTLQIGDGWLLTYADSIKVVESSISEEWPELIINEDFDWDVPSDGKRMKGEVIYSATLNSPIAGYLVYIESDREARLGKYFIKADNTFLTDELRELLDGKSTGYTIDITALDNGAPFKNSSIYGTFVVELLNE